MNPACVIVDANVVFKCLCAGRGDLRRNLASSTTLIFYSPRFLFVELFKYKDKIASAGNLAEPDLLQPLYSLLNRLEFVNEANIPLGTWLEAHRLCRDVD